MTASALRRNTGTHYTPRKLAEEVVQHALEPLLYHVGPLQTADESQWTHRSSDELLALKVADIAMGSAAFLVAAARYVGEALVTAWAREGKITRTLRDDTLPRDADEDPVVVDARRQVIEHCPAGRDLRYTIGPWAQREILDRLLELNHERYAEEVAKGLHDKKKARTTRAPKPADAEGLF